nr:MAG TPA: hypothetical protein [Caudoviricetes sp.]
MVCCRSKNRQQHLSGFSFLLSSRLALRRVLIAGLLYGGIRLSSGLMHPEGAV